MCEGGGKYMLSGGPVFRWWKGVEYGVEVMERCEGWWTGVEWWKGAGGVTGVEGS